MRPITEPKHQRALADEFDIKGHAIIAPHLEGTIQPVCLVADLTLGKSPDPQAVEALCSWSRSLTGGVTGTAAVQLQPPTGVVAVVRRIAVSGNGGGASQLFRWGTSPSVLGSTEQGRYQDTRRGGQPATIIGRQTASPISIDLPAFGDVYHPTGGGTVIVDGLEIVIPTTGNLFTIITGTVNVEGVFAIWWTERRQ